MLSAARHKTGAKEGNIREATAIGKETTAAATWQRGGTCQGQHKDRSRRQWD